jgi:hypothetical protein
MDDRWDHLEALVFLDVSQHLAPVHFGQVPIQQDDIWTWDIIVWPLTSQESYGVHAVARHMDTDGVVRDAERLLRQSDIAGTVFDQQDLGGTTILSDHSLCSVWLAR